MRKLFYILLGAFLLPVAAHAQVFSQNQLIITPYGGPGFIVSTTTNGGSKLQATSTPFFSSFFANNGRINSLTVGSCSGCGAASTTLLSDSNTFSGLLNKFNNTISIAAFNGLVGANNGLLYAFSSSSLFGFIPASNATTITVAGTANQITSSAGAQDLSTNRTWTLSLPQSLQFPLSFTSTYGTTTYASSTAQSTGNFLATNATSTSLSLIGGAANCNGTSALTTNSTGVVGCTAQPQGTVTSISVATANGFAGSSSGGATPALTLTTTITGLLKGNGTAISTATPGTDYDTFAWPFTPTSYGNATGTTIGFTLGILSVGSTTIVGNATTTGMHAFGNVRIPSLGVAAGTFIAVDANGLIIATTTPQGTSGAFSPAANYGTVASLPAYTTAAGVITEVGTGALSVDGSSPTVGQTVLVKNESGACTSSAGTCNNGLYNVTAAGSGIAAFVLTRNSNYNSSSNVIPGIVTYIISGATLADDFWALTTPAPITVGTTGLTYVEVSGGGAAVTSVSNSDATLTISPTTGAVVASLNLAKSNTWSVLQTFGNASTSLLTATYASSTQYFGANLVSCNSASNALTWNAGIFGCNTISSVSNAYPFTPLTTFGTTTSATSTGLWAQLGIYASSTSQIASTTFSINGNIGIGSSSPTSPLTLIQGNTSSLFTAFTIDGVTAGAGAEMALNRGANTGTEEANIDFNTNNVEEWQLGMQNNSTNDFELWDGLDDPAFTIKTGTNYIGFGTTTPFGDFAINADYGDVLPGNLIFNIASSSLTATTSLFSVNNIGSTTLYQAPLSVLVTNANSTIVGSSSLPISLGGTATSTLPNTNGVEFYNGTTITNGTGFLTNGVQASIGKGINTTIALDIKDASSQGLRLEGSTASMIGFSTFVTGDSQVRYTNLSDGTTKWGSGAVVADVGLSRFGVGTLALGNGSAADTSGTFLTTLMGLGTTSPRWPLEIASSSQPQLTLSDGSATDALLSFRNMNGIFSISSTSPNTFATSTFPLFTILTSTGNVGIGTTSPWAKFTIDRWGLSGTSIASSSILVTEYKIATTTGKTIDARDGNSQLFQIGGAATTITLTGFLSGSQMKLTVCNPNAVAGAITWATSPASLLIWTGDTTPVQTTTANKCDVYSFFGTSATTTGTGLGKIFGAQTAGF